MGRTAWRYRGPPQQIALTAQTWKRLQTVIMQSRHSDVRLSSASACADWSSRNELHCRHGKRYSGEQLTGVGIMTFAQNATSATSAVHTEEQLHPGTCMCMLNPMAVPPGNRPGCGRDGGWPTLNPKTTPGQPPEGREDGGDVVRWPCGRRPRDHAVGGADAAHMLQRRCTPLCRRPQTCPHVHLGWQRRTHQHAS